NIQPIAMAFDINAIAADDDGSGLVIDITDNITNDNAVFGFAGPNKSQFKVGSFQSDKSYIVSVRPYPTNIEITTVKTFSKSAESFTIAPGVPPSSPCMSTVTVEMNCSM